MSRRGKQAHKDRLRWLEKENARLENAVDVLKRGLLRREEELGVLRRRLKFEREKTSIFREVLRK